MKFISAAVAAFYLFGYFKSCYLVCRDLRGVCGSYLKRPIRDNLNGRGINCKAFIGSIAFQLAKNSFSVNVLQR